MKRQIQGIGVAALVFVMVVVDPVASARAATQAPPPPDTLVVTSNAMLQPSDTGYVPKGLRSWSSGYIIEPGGQDPTALCIDRRQRAVELDGRRAVGYRSSTDVNQELYVYDSQEAAAAAWAKADQQIGSRCTGSYHEDGSTQTLTSGRIASPVGGPQGWWIRSETTKGHGTSSYLTVLPVGSAIQLVYAYLDSAKVPASRSAQLDALTSTLSTRYVNAATAVVTQPALLTFAQKSMMQPADVPSTLPFTQPAANGWSSFTSYQPGDGPWVCGNSELPGGVATFETGFGGQGGVDAVPGAIDQRMEVYADAATAQAAWKRLTKALRSCDTGSSSKPGRGEPVNSTTTGVSALTFGGTRGVWSRDFDTYPSSGLQCEDDKGRAVRCAEFSSKSYTIHLLVGRSIQSVTYYKTVDGVRNPRIDQVAVNALAEQLAYKWAAAVG